MASHAWQLNEEINDGYPYIDDNFIVPVPSHIISVWKFASHINDGYPYIMRPRTVRPFPEVAPPVFRDPLIVFRAKDTVFDTNGIRILSPISAEHSLEFGQAGEITVVHPIDPEGDWKTMQCNNIILAPLVRRGKKSSQPFRIYKTRIAMDSSGQKTITAYARHIFYDLNEVLLDDVRPTDMDADEAIQYLFVKANLEEFYTDPRYYPWQKDLFSGHSNITKISTAYFQNVSLTNALIGADNSIANRWGGELYVDGYYFSLDSTMEFSKQNAFSIRYGVDLTSVSEEIDFSDYCTYIIARCNLGPWATLANAYADTLSPIPHIREVKFNYEEFDWEQFRADYQAYYDSVRYPKTSYSVTFAPLQKMDDYGDFEQLQYMEVGDTGEIWSETLDISTIQKIIKKTTDLLTGICTGIELGNAQNYFTAPIRWSNTISTGNSAAEKQLQAQQLASLGTWADAEKFTWAQLEQYTWAQIEGET